MSADEWRSTSWDIQRAYLEGLEQAEDVPFATSQGSGGMADGPVVRENVDAGVDVIDLSKMRAELEEIRRARKGGGVTDGL